MNVLVVGNNSTVRCLAGASSVPVFSPKHWSGTESSVTGATKWHMVPAPDDDDDDDDDDDE
jgi:hypothetical protein